MTIRSRICLAVAFMLVGSGPALAQTGVGSLSVGARRLELGSEARGKLTAADVSLADSSYAQAWGLELREGTQVTVDLLSDDFDAFLFVMGPGLDEAIRDDDGAGACDARITFTAPEDGMYRVIANTVGGETTGRFRLRVSEEPGPVTTGACGNPAALADWFAALPSVGRTLEIGSGVEGELTAMDSLLTDDSYAQAWDVRMSQDVSATIDLVSDDFDAFLMITGTGLEVLSDDDGAGACNARVTFTAPASATYRVIVNTNGAKETGRFELRVTAEPGPVTPGQCAEAGKVALLNGLPFEGQLTVGHTVDGELTSSDAKSWDDSYVQAWRLELERGQQVTVDLLSDEFDAYLMIVGTGFRQVLMDDDGAGGCNARITFTAARPGTFRVIPNTVPAETDGRFRLRVTDRPGPTQSGACQMGQP